MKRKAEDLTGQRFGRLVVLEKTKSLDGSRTYWLCQCDCGNTKIARHSTLKVGSVKSCGCLKRDNAQRASLINADRVKDKRAKSDDPYSHTYDYGPNIEAWKFINQHWRPTA